MPFFSQKTGRLGGLYDISGNTHIYILATETHIPAQTSGHHLPQRPHKNLIPTNHCNPPPPNTPITPNHKHTSTRKELGSTGCHAFTNTDTQNLLQFVVKPANMRLLVTKAEHTKHFEHLILKQKKPTAEMKGWSEAI